MEDKKAFSVVDTVQDRLAAAQLEFDKVVATHEVKTNKFSYKYANLEDVFKATLPALNRHGLAMSQSISAANNLLSCETTIYGPDGCYIKGDACVPMPSGSAQDFGSSISYVRRYSYQTVVGVAVGEEDTDGPPTGKFEREEKPVQPAPDKSKQSLTIALAQMATGAGLISGAGKARDASKFMELVKKNAPELFYPEDQQKPGKIVNWAIMTDAQYNKIVNAINKVLAPKSAQEDDLF